MTCPSTNRSLSNRVGWKKQVLSIMERRQTHIIQGMISKDTATNFRIDTTMEIETELKQELILSFGAQSGQ